MARECKRCRRRAQGVVDASVVVVSVCVVAAGFPKQSWVQHLLLPILHFGCVTVLAPLYSAGKRQG